HVLGDVAEPGPVAQATEEAAPLAVRAAVLLERGQAADEPFDEAGDHVARVLLELLEVEGEADHGPVAIEARPPVDAGFDELHSGSSALAGARRVLWLVQVGVRGSIRKPQPRVSTWTERPSSAAGCASRV